jgi:hypothetical protein
MGQHPQQKHSHNQAHAISGTEGLRSHPNPIQTVVDSSDPQTASRYYRRGQEVKLIF